MSLFQSTRPCGARLPGDERGRASILFQSTRPCGARHRKTDCVAISSCFNPRAHAGRDQWGAKVGTSKILFQSTRPCGARPVPCIILSNRLVFQSTRPCGARLFCRRNVFFVLLFQSTRPCGARPHPPPSARRPAPVSIHAPMRGATSSSRLFSSVWPSFNPRAHAGRDRD